MTSSPTSSALTCSGLGVSPSSAAIREIAPALFGVPVVVPRPGEYVADGAARQAAWVLHGTLPAWSVDTSATHEAEPTPEVVQRYREVRIREAAGQL